MVSLYKNKVACSIARAIALDLAITYDLSLLVDLPSSINRLVPYLVEWGQKFGLIDLCVALQTLTIPPNEAPLKAWWELNWQLERNLKMHWPKQLWHLHEERIATLLVQYLKSNLLLLECLAVASVPNRAAIEAKLLLPPKYNNGSD